MNTSNEKLHENYEDALFALLFNNFAEEEGARLIEENTKIKDDPSYRVPTEVYKSCKRTINEAFSTKEKAENRKRVKKNLLRVAVVMITFAVIFSGLYFSVSAVRENISSMIKNFRDFATVFKSDESTDIKGDMESRFISPDDENISLWLPDEFILNTYSAESNCVYAVFSDNNDNIVVYKELAVDSSYSIDTENADSVEYINVGENEGALIEKEGTISITWIDSNRSVSIRIKTQGLNREIAIKIANSVKYN